MKKSSLFSLFILIVLCGSSLFLAGCSTPKPVATAPPLYGQLKIYSVDHWDTVADTVAERVALTYEKREDLITKPLYIKQPNNKPFSIAFASLLRTRLVTRGMQVVAEYTSDAAVFEFDVQMVLHETNYLDILPTLADLGIGVVNFVTGKYPSRSDHEIIITSRIVQNNRYAMHFSTLCYIDDKDWELYGAPGIFGPQFTQSKVANKEVWNRYAPRGKSF